MTITEILTCIHEEQVELEILQALQTWLLNDYAEWTQKAIDNTIILDKIHHIVTEPVTIESFQKIAEISQTEDMSSVIKQNILTTEEVCSILSRTRQQLNNYIKQNQITPYIKTSNGNLFWKPEVLAFAKTIK